MCSPFSIGGMSDDAVEFVVKKFIHQYHHVFQLHPEWLNLFYRICSTLTMVQIAAQGLYEAQVLLLHFRLLVCGMYISTVSVSKLFGNTVSIEYSGAIRACGLPDRWRLPTHLLRLLRQHSIYGRGTLGSNHSTEPRIPTSPEWLSIWCLINVRVICDAHRFRFSTGRIRKPRSGGSPKAPPASRGGEVAFSHTAHSLC
ncbi:unnamed protein product [Hymenolepis diminuta]|uniref:Bestrophin homolog n=1 Tax=Hymenolepis diminuta TaxID=6216 RepID=A0A0R3SA54_HYMDI|nr:unnamed protein product [Hymenolepis diminuta]VUZ54452.1 unnamed protein product [Hymenolepis diminuta]